jgi:hypothetical protein
LTPRVPGALPCAARTIALACTALACVAGATAFPARAADDDNDDDAPRRPNVYLDLSTAYLRVPPNTLALGFRAFTLPLSKASQNVIVTAPLTIDVTDRLSLYAGVSGSTSRSDGGAWSAATFDSWHVGFSADLIRQEQGPGPTVTVTSTLTRTVSNPARLNATTNQTLVELDYALDSEQTRGLLAGGRVTAAWVDSPLVSVQPTLVGYLGGYYQAPDNWKLSGRLGVQTFGGARVANLVVARAFTQPTLRLDLDRMDDNDNRLFGVSLEIGWTPQPLVQMTLRTPLYAVRD